MGEQRNNLAGKTRQQLMDEIERLRSALDSIIMCDAQGFSAEPCARIAREALGEEASDE